VGAPQELILVGLSAMLKKGDHCLVSWPGYQSLTQTCTSVGADVGLLDVSAADFDLIKQIKSQSNKHTKAIVLNAPHNPTGYLPTKEEYTEMVSLCKENGWLLFSDEMYRWLELDPSDLLPSACESYENAVTLSGLSKSLSMPGLRMGWLATKNRTLLKTISNLKDYTTICPPAPSEILAIIALRNRETIIASNLEIIRTNLVLLNEFFKDHADRFEWQQPKAGSMCFPKLKGADVNVEAFCEDLVKSKSTLLLPGTMYNHNDNRFRLGFGRRNMPEALNQLKEFLTK